MLGFGAKKHEHRNCFLEENASSVHKQLIQVKCNWNISDLLHSCENKLKMIFPLIKQKLTLDFISNFYKQK